MAGTEPTSHHGHVCAAGEHGVVCDSEVCACVCVCKRVGVWACEREALPVPSGTPPACLEASEKCLNLYMVRKMGKREKLGDRSGSSLLRRRPRAINLHICTRGSTPIPPIPSFAFSFAGVCLSLSFGRLSFVLAFARLAFALRCFSLGFAFGFSSFLSLGSFSSDVAVAEDPHSVIGLISFQRTEVRGCHGHQDVSDGLPRQIVPETKQVVTGIALPEYADRRRCGEVLLERQRSGAVPKHYRAQPICPLLAQGGCEQVLDCFSGCVSRRGQAWACPIRGQCGEQVPVEQGNGLIREQVKLVRLRQAAVQLIEDRKSQKHQPQRLV